MRFARCRHAMMSAMRGNMRLRACAKMAPRAVYFHITGAISSDFFFLHFSVLRAVIATADIHYAFACSARYAALLQAKKIL